MRTIKFRAWDGQKMITPSCIDAYGQWYETDRAYEDARGDLKGLMQFTGLHDKDGKEIYEGDILEFTDKWEWYRTSYGIKMHFARGEKLAELKRQYDAEPMERREVELPAFYGWALDSSEIKIYWAVIGDIYQNPELLNPTQP